MRIEKKSLVITPTDDPAIFLVSGRATEQDNTVKNNKKTWYSFETRWNINRNAAEFADEIAVIVNEKKPKPAVTGLLAELETCNKSIADMSSEDEEEA